MSCKTKHICDFESAYHQEEKEILVLTSDNPSGATKDQGDVMWTAIQGFLAYVDVNTNELKYGDGRIVWPLTEDEVEDRETLLNRFRSGCVYRLKVRELIDKTVPKGMLASGFNRFLVVKVLEEDAQNDDLLVILAEYRKPVTFVDDVLGEFVLNKDLKFFEGSVIWHGKKIRVYLEVNTDSKGTWTKAIKVLRVLFGQQEQKDSGYRRFAAEKLLDLANQWSREEDAKSAEISKPDFMDRMSITSLSVTAGGNFTIEYDDGNLFWGHAITVSGHVKKGLKSANIEG